MEFAARVGMGKREPWASVGRGGPQIRERTEPDPGVGGTTTFPQVLCFTCHPPTPPPIPGHSFSHSPGGAGGACPGGARGACPGGAGGPGPGVAEAVVDVSCNPSSSAPPGIVPTEPVAIVPSAAGARGRAAFHASSPPLRPHPNTHTGTRSP